MKNCKFLEKAFFLLAAGVTLFTMQACEEKEEPVLLPNVDREDMMEAIDLGLPSGTLWASCNLGASSPEEYGDYFAWGETDVKDGYSWQTYQWCNGTYESMSTDCVDSVELNQQYDAAFAKWGDQWRMPTVADFKELVTECTWTWTAQNGVKGYLVTGSNENSIFLPAAGCQRDGTILHGGYTGCYWSKTLYESDTQHAHLLYFNNDSYSYKFRNFRVDGRSVRPITGGGNVSDEPEEDEDKPSEGDEVSNDQEREKLIELYYTTNGQSWNIDNNWCSNKPLNEWYGVKTNASGNVISIDLSNNNLTGRANLSFNDFPSLTSLNVNNNKIEELSISANENVTEISLNNCATRSIVFNGFKKVDISCESLESLFGECEILKVSNCDFGDNYTPFSSIRASNVTIYNCKMHSCGVSSDILTFENSSTYNTWYCYTNKRLNIINSYCSTICGGDFNSETIICMQNATLWRSNWDEESTVTFTCTTTGDGWDDLF